MSNEKESVRMNRMFINRTNTVQLNNSGQAKRLFPIKTEKTVILMSSTSITANDSQFSAPAANS